MNKAKRLFQGAMALGVLAVGIYMLVMHAWGTPPAISGVGFILAGLGLWTPYCPGLHALVGDRPTSPRNESASHPEA